MANLGNRNYYREFEGVAQMCVKYTQLGETLAQWQIPSKESFSYLKPWGV